MAKTPLIWRKTILRNICDVVQYGYTASAVTEAVGPKFLRITDIVPSLIDWNSVPYCAIDQENASKYLVEDGDIVIARTGATTGYAKRLKNPPTTVFASYLVRLKIKKGEDNRFVGAVVESDNYKKFIMTNIGGSAQPNANAQVLTSYPLSLPPLSVQKRIAGILSAYDDFIENNTRRIKILEEMAQRIYRQWFVEFKFPGHEKVKMVDSLLGKIPQGWEVKALGEVCSRITDGAHRSPKTTDNGFPMASVKDMHDWGINIDTCRRISEEEFEYLSRNDCKMRKGDILIAKDGSYLKHCFVIEKDQDVALLSSIAMLRPNLKIASHVLAMILREPNTKARMGGFVSGVALPRIILKAFREFQIILPPMKFQKEWLVIAEPMIKKCWRLIDINTNLRRTRDLLLPKLISGAIEV